jgi:predicted patatin/cPLA2 family phospholipase
MYKQYDENTDAATEQEFREKLTELVPQIYHRLNSFASIKQNIQIQQQQQQQVLKILEYSLWIWVGDSFVSVDQVALSSGLNIPPYLYQLPQDLKV